MGKLLRLAVCLALAIGAGFLLAPNARTQTAPTGWAVYNGADGWLATSPDQGGGARVRLLYLPLARASQAMDAWVVAESLRHAQSMGRVVWTQNGVTRDQNLAGVSRTIIDSRNVRTAVIAWAYETQRGRQLLLVIAPVSIANGSAYNAAQTRWGQTWQNRTGYEPGRSQPTPPAVAQNNPPQSTQSADRPPANGRNCRREAIWGFRRSVFCQPSGVCADREIKGYEWVCD